MTEEELKLLLWCIRLEPDSDCFHRIGRGKPFGMGKVKIIVEGLDEITYSLDENHKLKRNTRDIKSDYEGISYSDEQKAIMKHLSSYMTPLTIQGLRKTDQFTNGLLTIKVRT